MAGRRNGLRRPAARDRLPRPQPGVARAASRRGPRSTDHASQARLVRRPGTALARGTGDLEHAAGRRWHRLHGSPLQRLVHGTEIGARNLADPDRYDMLPTIARRLGLDTSSNRSLWKDRALVELNLAVLWSFDQ